MKIYIAILFCVILSQIATKKATLKFKAKNPGDGASESGGGDNGEFLRRNQPQEHIIIPLINSLEVEYPMISNIKDYRRERLMKDKNLDYKQKRIKEMQKELNNLINQN